VAIEITLSRAQIAALAELAKRHPHSVTVRNEGEPFLLLDLHDARGTVIDRFRMPYDEQHLVQVSA
jgi:hypothetical protein